MNNGYKPSGPLEKILEKGIKFDEGGVERFVEKYVGESLGKIAGNLVGKGIRGPSKAGGFAYGGSLFGDGLDYFANLLGTTPNKLTKAHAKYIGFLGGTVELGGLHYIGRETIDSFLAGTAADIFGVTYDSGLAICWGTLVVAQNIARVSYVKKKEKKGEEKGMGMIGILSGAFNANHLISRGYRLARLKIEKARRKVRNGINGKKS